MARSYAKLMVGIAVDPDFAALSSLAQRLYLLLLANPKLSSCGCIPYQPTKWVRWSADSTLEQVARSVGELVSAGYVLVDDDTEELFVRSFIRHDGGFKNPKMLKGIQSTIGAIESEAIRVLAISELTKAQVDRQSNDDQTDDRTHDRSKPDSNCSLQPATLSPSTPQPAAVVLGDPLTFLSDEQRQAAAAAYEKWLTWRLAQPDVKHPSRIVKTLREDAPEEWHGAIAAHFMEHPDASEGDLLYSVFKLNPTTMQRRSA